MYTIGYSQDWEGRMVPASHWNCWGPTASNIELGRRMLSSRSVLCPSPFSPSQPGPASTSSHGQSDIFQLVNCLHPASLSDPHCTQNPVFRCLLYLVCTSSLEDHMHRHGFKWAKEAQNCYAGPASTLSFTEALWLSLKLFFMEILSFQALKSPAPYLNSPCLQQNQLPVL